MNWVTFAIALKAYVETSEIKFKSARKEQI